VFIVFSYWSEGTGPGIGRTRRQGSQLSRPGSDCRDKPIIVDAIAKDSHFRTDESGVYWKIGEEFASHKTVIHSIGEYVRGDAHTNTVEGYFSIFKRGIYGVYHHVSQEYLKRYLCEFDFRYNYRVALGFSDKQRTDAIMRGIAGKRLTYRRTRGQAEEAGAAWTSLAGRLSLRRARPVDPSVHRFKYGAGRRLAGHAFRGMILMGSGIVTPLPGDFGRTRPRGAFYAERGWLSMLRRIYGSVLKWPAAPDRSGHSFALWERDGLAAWRVPWVPFCSSLGSALALQLPSAWPSQAHPLGM
jgi:hypothetical protein